MYSFVTFSVGAAIPLLPFLITSGQIAFVAAIILALASLFVVGALVSIVTGRSMIVSGLRQVLIGAAAAAVTYAVGNVIGATVA
jgi:VIT1/CCC1 family predicted Fe2+/Mn2+ transporter